MHYCVGVEADRKGGKSAKWQNRKFSKLEIQQTGNWKFNKSRNFGKLEIQQFLGLVTKATKWESYVNSRSARIRKAMVCSSGTLPQTFHKSRMAVSVRSLFRFSGFKEYVYKYVISSPCYYYAKLLASFPGRSHLQYLIAYSTQIRRGKAWEISSRAVTSGRQKVDTRGAVPYEESRSPFLYYRSEGWRPER